MDADADGRTVGLITRGRLLADQSIMRGQAAGNQLELSDR